MVKHSHWRQWISKPGSVVSNTVCITNAIIIFVQQLQEKLHPIQRINQQKTLLTFGFGTSFQPFC